MFHATQFTGFGGATVSGPYVAGTAGVVGFTSVSIPIPSGLLADDIILIFLETTNGSTVSTPSGYTLAGSGTDSSTTQIHVFWKRASGSETSFTQTNTDHQAASVLLIRDALKSGTPYEAFASGSISSTDTPSIPSLTTLGPDRLVIQAISRGNDVATTAPFSAPTNSIILVSIADQRATNSGNGGGLAEVVGGMLSAGACGATTLSNSDGAITYAYATFAMKPL